MLQGSQARVWSDGRVVIKEVKDPKVLSLEVSAYEAAKGLPGVVEMLSYNPAEGTLTLAHGGISLFCVRAKQRAHWDKVYTQIETAVRSIHARRLVHGDLKLENILIDGEGVVRLCDFGHSRLLTQQECGLACLCRTRGSPAYTCPEILSGLPYDGFAADAWSLGVVLYALVLDAFPFRAAHTQTKEFALFAESVYTCHASPTDALLTIWAHRLPALAAAACDPRFRDALDALLSLDGHRHV